MSVKFTSKGLADGTDDTKELEFNVAGVTTGNTRTITVPDRDVTIGNAGDLTGTLPAIDGSALTGMAGSEGFVARFTSNMWNSYPNGAILPFNEDSGGAYDDGGNYSTSTYKYTAPTTGVYVFWASIYTGNNDGASGFQFVKNTGNLDYMSSSTYFMEHRDDNAGVEDMIVSANIQVKLNAGDTIWVSPTRTSDIYTGHSAWGGYRLS